MSKSSRKKRKIKTKKSRSKRQHSSKSSRKNRRLRTSIVVLLILAILACIVILAIGVEKTVDKKIEEKTERLIGIIDDTNESILYLPVGESYQLDYKLNTNMKKSKYVLSYTSSNDEVVSVDENGLVTCLSDGEARISITVESFEKYIDIVSTSLIQIPNENNIYNKPLVKCGMYSKEDNDLLDEILEYRINKVGLKTRAGVVAAARFLTLELPYRINYFYENGRLANGVDGEGRYYHKGLYLNENKYDDINDVAEGKTIWGCPLFSYEEDTYSDNGLDCSGFVSWVLLNGGFDSGDLGAGAKDLDGYSFYNIADKEDNDINNIKALKAGDLVHNDKANGHIGIVIGIDDDYIYVAQAIWYDTRGVVVTKYTYDEFVDDWLEVIYMDSYYEENGNYTAMW